MPRRNRSGTPSVEEMNDDDLVSYLEGSPEILDAHYRLLQKRILHMQGGLYERAVRVTMRGSKQEKSTGHHF
ncbi:MAG TPA: hypothetical protein VHA78_04060 [Candidatus Peribacteraceae bacterium]|nr:hypothetical protein [Candidatus Peribacteraceae bacterium]